MTHPASNFTLFADDTTVCVSADTLEESLEGSMIAQEVALGWFCSNELLLNTDKTIRMVFSMRSLDGVDAGAQGAKFLGVNVDRRLLWEDHILFVRSKLASGLYLLRGLAGSVSLKVLKTAYYGIFHSHISYATLVWGHSAAADHLFGLQRRAIRILAGLGYRDDCRHAFVQLSVLTLPSIFIMQNLLYIKSNLHLYRAHMNIHQYETRNRSDILPDFWRLKRCQSGPGYWAIKFFNKLPKEVKDLPLYNFKKRVYGILAGNAFYSQHEFLNFNFNMLYV